MANPDRVPRVKGLFECLPASLQSTTAPFYPKCMVNRTVPHGIYPHIRVYSEWLVNLTWLFFASSIFRNFVQQTYLCEIHELIL